MAAQIDCALFVYTIDREGCCILDMITQHGEMICAVMGESLMPPGTFGIFETMHQRAGHDLILHAETDTFIIWFAWTGPGMHAFMELAWGATLQHQTEMLESDDNDLTF